MLNGIYGLTPAGNPHHLKAVLRELHKKVRDLTSCGILMGYTPLRHGSHFSAVDMKALSNTIGRGMLSKEKAGGGARDLTRCLLG